ncbi:stage III sporulation protein AA [Texcoconibacillus texcoconensis]|uniref:Stage III sporulation protein AA n=1 Tax=Texcoconibacillus texcoconensis TaxID=1095777 RepID=A0A840QP26_9BACI|nr:stage III sporulation protein AA [Texcoconibacillus texcoconensis]MBB5173083.1 stage III sporulation protein AA [Texcoconibacillus texcoconensis]
MYTLKVEVNSVKEVFDVLPKRLVHWINSIDEREIQKIEEIRIRHSQALELDVNGRVMYLPGKGSQQGVRDEEMQYILNQLSNYSLYTLDEELKRGYITIKGGHRVGLAGKVVTDQGRVKGIRAVSSFNIRIAKQTLGVADRYVPRLIQAGKWKSTLLIGAPKTGKTTFLRDIARIISEGFPSERLPAKKVGIVDERSEIAGSLKGVPQHTFGPRVDVLDACPKAEGMMMMIRSMSPDVLVVDEIGRKEDTEAIVEAMNAGVRVIASVHGDDWHDVRRRPALEPLWEGNVFERFVEFAPHSKPGTIAAIRRPRDVTQAVSK